MTTKQNTYKKLFIALVFVLSCSFAMAQNETLFQRGNDLYNQGKYEEAIEVYEKILESNKHSAELYFNLGNAHYKLNNIAPSIYNFEKALILKPNDKEIQNNIAFAQNMTIDAIDNIPEVGFRKLLKSIINKTTFDNWAKISVGFVFGFVIIFLLYYFSHHTARKRLAFISSFLFLFLAMVALALAFQKSELDAKNNPAIVFARETIVKSDPNNTSTDLFRLHEGTKVQVLETFDDWNKIKLSDGQIGWMQSTDLRTIKF